MSIKLGIVMDPIAHIHYKKDSSLAMLWAAAEKGWVISYFERGDLYIDNGVARGHATALTVRKDPKNWYQFGDTQDIKLGDLDVILMRKDPPFDMNFIYCTYILSMAEADGALIVNKPESLRNYNEKVFATHFPHCCAPTLVSQKKQDLQTFVEQHTQTILKPLDGMGGASIFRVDFGDANLGVILETLTGHGQRPIMAQRFIPEIKDGDKRILVINGDPVPYALARIPAKGEVRGNLAAGGTGRAQELSDRDRWLVEQIAPTLKAKGLLFVGVDVIGDYITEINVTSPTCIREIDAAYDTDIAGKLMSTIAEIVEEKRSRL